MLIWSGRLATEAAGAVFSFCIETIAAMRLLYELA
jgi:hypothetical protein